MIEITLRGRTIPLEYTSLELLEIQKEIAPFDEAITIVTGLNPKNSKDLSKWGKAEHIEAVGKMIKILGNAGLEIAGKEPDLTLKNVLRGIRPGELLSYQNAIMDALNEGLKSEIPEKKQEGPVDVVLEEIKKNETPEGSPI